MSNARPTSALKGPDGSSQSACLQCRSVKMKCRRSSTSAICERCLRKSMDCVVEKHKRGRKPGTRLARKASDRLSIERPSQSRGMSGRDPDLESSLNEQLMSAAVFEEISTHYPSQDQECNEHDELADPWGRENALQPAELLNEEAKTGRFSLQSVLSTVNESNFSTVGSEENFPEIFKEQSLDDPIACNILNFPVALGLFDSFMRSLNPFISQFDPNLHTFSYVQQKSAFLLTSILAAAARAFHPPLHAKLRAHTETLLAKAFSQGTKSTETVQAILVSSYWKEPDDTRSWLLVGYAIRMCIELGWHKLRFADVPKQDSETELQIREARNIRRTWLILFVYDRSISLQMGKPCMIEQTEFFTKAGSFYKQPFAIYGVDVLLCAFASLRIISSEILELVSAGGSSRHLRQPPNPTLMKLLNDSITSWEEYWFAISDDTRVDPCQAFLIRFYGTHLRLILNSFPLQESLITCKSGPQLSKQAIWTCHSTALNMLKQISDKFGPLKLLYFAQDSVHVMTAYAAVFIVKLLLSLPSHISKELEVSSIEAIRKTARTFEAQCATQKTGCALQARFLNNVAVQYEKAKQNPPSKTAANSRNQTQDGTSPQSPLKHVKNACSSFPELGHSIENGAGRELTEEFQQSLRSSDLQTSHFASNELEIEYQGNFVDWNFDNDDKWEQMFAHAGYRICDGVFLPDNGILGHAQHAL